MTKAREPQYSERGEQPDSGLGSPRTEVTAGQPGRLLSRQDRSHARRRPYCGGLAPVERLHLQHPQLEGCIHTLTRG
jgi:hypothetical protein